MTKADIIYVYNSLTPVLQNEIDTYKELVGKVNPYYPYSVAKNLLPTWKPHTKEELESMLKSRKNQINNISAAKDNFIKVKKMESSEEGKTFIEMLVDEKKKTAYEIQTLTQEFRDSIDIMFEDIDLDWKLAYPYTPSHEIYFSICHKEIKNAEISMAFFQCQGKWVVTVNTSTGGSRDIDSRDAQYYKFKAYTTICDNCDYVQKWVETKYADFVERITALYQKYDQINRDIDNPYDAYMRTK